MAPTGRDKEFRLAKITYMDYRFVEMDRTLTLLFPRLRWDGRAARRPQRGFALTIDEFTREFIEKQQWFAGFDQHPDIVRRWIETDLLDLVNRGKPNQAVAAPRPLHGNTYKFRNTTHIRDSGEAQHLYWMLHYARSQQGQGARDGLKNFFFEGLDPSTYKYDPTITVDVETQALLRLDEQVKTDMADPQKPEAYAPLFRDHADLLAEDTLRLLAYRHHIPRSVLVEYLKTLFAFHLALYHLRLFKVLPLLVQRHGHHVESLLEPPQRNHLAQIGLVVDMGDVDNQHMQVLATQSAELHYRRIPEYIRAHYSVKKLDEMVEYFVRLGKAAKPADGYFSVPEVIHYLDESFDQDREKYFGSRLANIVEKQQNQEDLDPVVRRVVELGLSDFETYIEVLVALRGTWQRSYVIDSIDSLLQKNRDTGLLRQLRGGKRYLHMGSRLLETLLQIAVMTQTGTTFKTKSIRVDELLSFLRDRYGIYIDQLPTHDGFSEPTVIDRKALRKNISAFKQRLHEIGFFQDLSDAYITQTITPRYTIEFA